MAKLLLGFVLAVTLFWSPTFRANPPDREPVLRLLPVPEPTIGLASWYGERFQGKTTANGEIYDMNGLTAAHRDLHMGTWVEITNLRNGRSVTVRINDRGPSIRGRMIDVSKATARALGFVGAGVTTVQMRIVDSSESSDSARSPIARPIMISSAHSNLPAGEEPVSQQ
ncbi:MAG: septal ring lytic transglycosylase RlpA family protein [Acidobacteria bacterium]|nr:septal ring lytic transglycosylase RlpA family protein [Acidobacteriota bacterium]